MASPSGMSSGPKAIGPEYRTMTNLANSARTQKRTAVRGAKSRGRRGTRY